MAAVAGVATDGGAPALSALTDVGCASVVTGGVTAAALANTVDAVGAGGPAALMGAVVAACPAGGNSGAELGSGASMACHKAAGKGPISVAIVGGGSLTAVGGGSVAPSCVALCPAGCRCTVGGVGGAPAGCERGGNTGCGRRGKITSMRDSVGCSGWIVARWLRTAASVAAISA